VILPLTVKKINWKDCHMKNFFLAILILQLFISCSNDDCDNNNVIPETNRNIELEIPVDADPSDDFIIKRSQYVLSYNYRRNLSNWVSWNLHADWFGDAPRNSNFIPDIYLPDSFYQVESSDYTNSGYDRGHIVRSNERTNDPCDNLTTFYMTNIMPQLHDLNGGPWLKLEDYCKDLCLIENKELFIVGGGIFSSDSTINNWDSIPESQRIAVPDSFFKIIVILERDQGLRDIDSSTQVIAVAMPNINGIMSNGWEQYTTTVDRIEESTGYNFLDLIPDVIENYLENN